jgi:drug/metabolite transporter (DMT)-like permease
VVWASSAAVVGMLGYGVGTVLQAAGAARARGPAVLRQPLYLGGLGCDGVGWLASLVALQGLPLFAVQAVLAGSLAVTVLLARVFLRASLRTRDWFAVAAVALALVVIAVSAGVQSSLPPPHRFAPTMGASLLVLAVITLAFYRGGGPVPMALLAGLAFSGAALCARASHLNAGWPLVGAPVTWCLLGFGVIGALTFSRGLESSAVGLVAAVLWVVEVLVPGVIGLGLLGDRVRAGWDMAAVLAVAVAVAGCVVLATSPAQTEG